MTSRVAIGILAIVIAADSIQANDSKTDSDWSGVFRHPDQRRNEGREIRVTKSGDQITLEGFYEGFTFKRRSNNSFTDSSIGTLCIHELQTGGLLPLTIISYQFCYEAGFLTGTTTPSSQETQLCEFRCGTKAGHAVAALEPGNARLSGGYRPAIREVADNLNGAQFIRVPWKSRPAYRITVTKPGYLYALKMYRETRSESELEWEDVGVSVKGRYLNQPVYRTRVNEGQIIDISGYELSLIAARIDMQ